MSKATMHNSVAGPELTEADLALVSGGTPSLSYGGAVFTYTPQSGGGGEGPETVTIWGIVMTVPQPK